MTKTAQTIKTALAFALIVPVRVYQLFISPLLPASCRYAPTCSQYAIEALRLHGPVKGLVLAMRRIGRCHPWGGHGHDPVPAPREKGAACCNHPPSSQPSR